MKFIPIILLSVLTNTICSAQTTDKQKNHALSIEIGKTGLIYNLTYDSKLPSKHWGYRLVAGSNFAKYLNAVSIGGGAYHLVGNSNHFLELGADLQYLIVSKESDDQKGFAFLYPDHSIKTFYPSLNIGYRSYGRHTLFRIGFSPGIIKTSFVPGGYVSYGLLF